jgi:hypothetical protein
MSNRDTPNDSDENLQRELQQEEHRLRLMEVRLRAAQVAEEIRQLQAIDPTAGTADTTLGQIAPSSGRMPKDKEPPTFEGKSRSNYDDWVRTLERHFRRYPTLAASEALKIDYASDFAGKLQVDTWERHTRQLGDGEVPTWSMMKQVMLDSMGSEDERRQRAHERLKIVVQGLRSPSELLEEMKECWYETGEDREDQMVHQFITALNKTSRLEMKKYPVPAKTLKEAEERANSWHRLNAHTYDERREAKYGSGRKRQGTNTAPSPPGGRNLTRRSTPATEGSSKAQSQGRPPPVCYNCRQVGHIKRDCPHPQLADDKSGKDKAPTRSSHE